MSKNRKRQDARFRNAVEKTPDISKGFYSGLRALGRYTSVVKPSDTALCEGSVDIDKCTEQKYPLENRWDFMLAYEGEVYFVEVHSAETAEVNKVIRKLGWLKEWLQTQAPLIDKMKASSPYYWVQSGRFSISPTSPQYRRLVAAKIRPIAVLKLG